MKILGDDRVLGARELEHVCLNVRVERQGHTFANLVLNTSKNSSQITRSVKTLGYKIFIIKIYNIYLFDALLNMRICKHNVLELWACI
jgi:hypothetical protein